MTETRKFSRSITISMPMLAAGALAGVICGLLVLGIGGRIAMRVVALIVRQAPGFTVGGTMLILIMGSVLGLMAGLLYAALRGLLPLRGFWAGLLYGLAIALLLVGLPLFLSNPQGELALVSPSVILVLFGGLIVAYGAGVGALADRIARRSAAGEAQQIDIVWLAALLVATVFYFMQSFSLGGEFHPIPHFFATFLRDKGVGFTAMRELNSGLTLIFAVSYFTLTMAVLLAGGGQRIRRWSALVLLLIGGLLFNSGTRPFGIPHSAGIWIAGLPRLLQAMGLGALTALIYIMPDGYFRSRRWRILAGLWTGWFVVWLVPLLPGTILDSMEWPPVLRPLPIILAVASGLLSLYLRHRDARPAERPALVLLLAGYGLTFFTLLIVWLAITSVDGWLAGRAIGISHLFSFTPYLLPWLALPAVTLVALSRRHAVEEARHEAMPVI